MLVNPLLLEPDNVQDGQNPSDQIGLLLKQYLTTPGNIVGFMRVLTIIAYGREVVKLFSWTIKLNLLCVNNDNNCAG